MTPRPGPPAPCTTIPLRSPLRQPSTFNSAGMTRSFALVRWNKTQCSLPRTPAKGLSVPVAIWEGWEELVPARRTTSFWLKPCALIHSLTP